MPVLIAYRLHGLAYDDGVLPDKTAVDEMSASVYLYRSLAGGGLSTIEWCRGRSPKFDTLQGRLAWAIFGWHWATNTREPAPRDARLPYASTSRLPWPGSLNYRVGNTQVGGQVT